MFDMIVFTKTTNECWIECRVASMINAIKVHANLLETQSFKQACTNKYEC